MADLDDQPRHAPVRRLHRGQHPLAPQRPPVRRHHREAGPVRPGEPGELLARRRPRQPPLDDPVMPYDLRLDHRCPAHAATVVSRTPSDGPVPSREGGAADAIHRYVAATSPAVTAPTTPASPASNASTSCSSYRSPNTAATSGPVNAEGPPASTTQPGPSPVGAAGRFLSSLSAKPVSAAAVRAARSVWVSQATGRAAGSG